MARDFHPLCMTAEELELWEEANERLNAAVSGPCLDCPVAWRQRMNAVGLCNRQRTGPGARPTGKHDASQRAYWTVKARQYRARKAAAA